MVQPIVSAPPDAALVTISIVSHGQEALVAGLLAQLAAQADPLVAEVILTHNLPSAATAPPPGGWPFRFTEVFNAQPAGFAANHNRTFRRCTTACFCVLNPDIELVDPAIWQRLVEAVRRPGVGCAYPALRDPDGTRQDNERAAVTPSALWRRHVLKRPEARTDWVSAAFWLVAADAWRSVGGLDERFRMYCEDTDFCLRLQLAGWGLVRARTEARHGAARASRRPGLRMAWHVRSLLRLWSSPTLWRFLAFRAKARQ